MFSDSVHSGETKDEDFTHVSEDNVPYLAPSPPNPNRSTSATTGKRSNNIVNNRPQTAPTLESSALHSEDSPFKRTSSDADDISALSVQRLSTPPVKNREPSHSARRKVQQAPTGTTYRGRVELDLTESGSRLPLKPPVARTVKLNTRSSKSKPPPPVEAFPDLETSCNYVVTDDHEEEVVEGLANNSAAGQNDEKKEPDAPLKPPVRMAQFLYNDPDNKQYSAQKKKDNLSEADKSALRLGRLVLSTVLNQPELSVPDAISRFFMDTWLAKNGSSITKADGLSVSLMTNLQKAFTEYDPGVDVGAIQAASCQKTVAAIACETLDTLIQAFGDSNPVLYDIRESLMPLIYMNPPDLVLPMKKLTAETLAEDTKLSGERYINVDTWCEDGAVIVEDLRTTENNLFLEQQKATQASSEVKEMFAQFEKLQHESKNAMSLMLKARADTEQSESNYAKLLYNFETQATLLAEEQKKYSLENEKYIKEHKAALVFNMKLSGLKSKYEDLLVERDGLKEQKMRLKNDISILNKTIATSQSSFEASRKNIEILKLNAKEIKLKLETEENNRKLREEWDQEIIKNMHDFFGSNENTNQLMSHHVHDMLTHKPVVAANVLDAWTEELLGTINNLEEQLRATQDKLEQMDDSNLKKLQEENRNEIQILHAANSKQMLELKEQHKTALAAMEENLKIQRSNNLELTFERNTKDKQLEEAEERQLEMKLAFEDGNSKLMSQIQNLKDEKDTMREQLCALQSDHMLEEVLCDMRLTNSGLNEKVFYLVKSIGILNRDLAGK